MNDATDDSQSLLWVTALSGTTLASIRNAALAIESPNQAIATLPKQLFDKQFNINE